jgi:type IV pilus assembly protein PilA
MKFPQTQYGFTLIELMIVVTIIGIVFSIAIPIYYQQINKAKTSACLYEVKSYSNLVYIELNEPDATIVSITSTPQSCLFITNARGWTSQTQQKIMATAKPPSNARIECDVPNGAPCRVLP